MTGATARASVAGRLRIRAGRLPAPARAVGRTVGDFIARVFIEPVQSGWLRAAGWPVGLRPIVSLAIAGEVAGVLLVLLAGPIRAGFELSSPQGGEDAVLFPRSILWVLVALTALSLSLAQLGALHARAWLRWVITSVVAVVLLLIATSDSGLDPLRTSLWASVAGAAGVILLTALRGHRRFAWWEFLVVFVLVSVPFVVSLTSLNLQRHAYGLDAAALSLSFALSIIGQLAIPAAIAAGSAVAELAVATSAWSVTAVRDNLGRIALTAVVALVAAWRVLDLALTGHENASEPVRFVYGVITAMVLVGAVILLWQLIARLRGSTATAQPTTRGLLEGMPRIALPIAIGLTIPVVPSLIFSSVQLILVNFGMPLPAVAWLGALPRWFSTETAVSIIRILVGAAAIMVALLIARRRRVLLPETLGAVGVAYLLLGVTSLLNPLTRTTPALSDGLASLGGAAALAILLAYLVRGRLGLRRLAAIGVALLASAMLAHREFISDPLAALLGGGTLAVALLGLVWGRLTSYGRANGDSLAYPRPARVLLALGNSLFAFTMLAFLALARDPEAGIDLGAFAIVGQVGFGNALIAGALVVALAAAIRDREVA